MPRSARTDSVQNAFINLGDANQRYSNIVLDQRNRQRSERGQIGGIAGGIIGGYFGGPAGAAAGSAVGSKILGGDVQDGRTGANIGVAVANQQNQAEQQEQQQRSIAALQGARKDAANQRVIETGEVVQPSFFTSFKETQPEQQPPQFVAAPQTETFQQGNVGFQDIFPRPNENQAVVSSIPEIDVQKPSEAPINNLTQVSQNEQPNIGLATLETAPLASTGRVPGSIKFQTPFEQIIGQQENQLAVEQAALNDPRLSRFPGAFAAQQQTVNALQNQINQAKFQFASMREKQLIKGGKTGEKVTDNYARFLTDLSQSNGTGAEVDNLSKRLLSLYNSNQVSEKDFKEQSEALTEQKLQSIDRNFKQSEAVSRKAITLSDRFDKETKKPREAIESADKIIQLGKLKGPNGIRDLAQVVGFLKTIDPGSVARESEVDAVRGAISVLGRIQSAAQKAGEGVLLTDDQKKQIEEAAQVIRKASLGKVRAELDARMDQARNNGVPIKNIFSTRKIYDSFNTSSLSTKDKNSLRNDIKAIRDGETGPNGRIVTLQDLEISYGLR